MKTVPASQLLNFFLNYKPNTQQINLGKRKSFIDDIQVDEQLNQYLGFARKSYEVHLNNYALVTASLCALHCPEESNQTLRVRKHKKGLLCCRTKVSLRTCLRLFPIIDNLQNILILFTRYMSDFAAKESDVLKSQSQEM
ncbi:unnamed protein product (macronuclear) [Paramecium tetraurelia]|uniref:Uncharacterized protein n=1 Tax=Paramecium tetraurelia TaxID=5888 RepID=A0D697_PARTE|nr:uncharacterized protein GSPATT00039296001 [Paramecium tetraurelia]CAK78564.1 unnamed protein product [Paramecium tetraurelia]|eukprot:XP_001445961.1 hypothetical protein (macronuclear) [Paramecium tetraurelia strain d4-2]